MRRNKAAVPVGLPQIQSSEQQEHQGLVASLLATIRHHFGSLRRLFEPIEDARDGARTKYPLVQVLFTGLMMFLCHLGARRQVGLRLRTDPSVAKMAELFGVEGVPHGDTVNATFAELSVEQVQEVLCRMVEKLIRSKMLYPYRLLGRYFRVAIDATGALSFDERHCPHCLSRKHGSKTIFYHPVLEAKLVTENGFAFSLMTEFIENANEAVSKQDCEIKAFKRLAPRLKKRFPRLPIALLLDGLYAEGPVFDICREYGWKYIMTLKDNDLPFVNTEFKNLFPLQSENRLSLSIRQKESIHQDFRWVDNIEYVDTERRQHVLSVLECVETKRTTEHVTSTKYKWVTNIKLRRKNVPTVANQGGRLRWKIENEGFNAQKNGGFELEHVYSNHPVASKVFYLLMQCAHFLFQLLSKGSLLHKLFPEGFGSLKNLASTLLEAWRLCPMTRYILTAWRHWRFQVRFVFDTS